MFDFDEEGFVVRCLIRKKGKFKGYFIIKGVNWVCLFDGYDKFMGYRNSIFLLVVYGCIDIVSCKFFWLRVWVINFNLKVVGRWYFEYLYESRVMFFILRLDKGIEIGVIITMYVFLR